MMSGQLKIQMLGGFDISVGDNSVARQVRRSSKIWYLLQYLIVHRNRMVSQDELIDAFWPDGNEANPGNAMRTMVYRLRAALVASGIPRADELIQYQQGGYVWNNEIDYSIDIEEFEKLCQQANASYLDASSRMSLLLQAEALYRGDFLPSAATELWAIPITRYYRSMYLKCIVVALDLMTAEGLHAEIEMLSEKALLADPFNENIREYHLQALLSQGKLAKAIEEYKKIESLFYDELGVAPSETLKKIYIQIKSLEDSSHRSLEELIVEWREGADFPGAYYCDYDVFRSVFHITARSLSRTHTNVYIICLDLTDAGKARDMGVIRQLEESIPSKLRKGDLFTRSSSSQYILMLQGLAYEDCRMLIKRIVRSIPADSRALIAKTSIQPVAPLL